MPATYTAPEIVSRLSPLARDLARVGVLAHADAAKVVAQLRRLGLGYAACRKSRALGAPPRWPTARTRAIPAAATPSRARCAPTSASSSAP